MARIVDPNLLAQIVRELNVQGPLSPFEISEVAIPVFDIGQLSGVSVQEVVTPGLLTSVLIGTAGVQDVLQIGQADFENDEVVDDSTAAPAAGTVLADTGQLPAARTQFQAGAGQDDNIPEIFELQWRNAANAATLANFRVVANGQSVVLNFRLSIGTNERLRWVNTSGIVNTAVTWIASARANTQVAT